MRRSPRAFRALGLADSRQTLARAGPSTSSPRPRLSHLLDLCRLLAFETRHGPTHPPTYPPSGLLVVPSPGVSRRQHPPPISSCQAITVNRPLFPSTREEKCPRRRRSGPTGLGGERGVDVSPHILSPRPVPDFLAPFASSLKTFPFEHAHSTPRLFFPAQGKKTGRRSFTPTPTRLPQALTSDPR